MLLILDPECMCPEIQQGAHVSKHTTPCHRMRLSLETVLISNSMVSGESGALKQTKPSIVKKTTTLKQAERQAKMIFCGKNSWICLIMSTKHNWSTVSHMKSPHLRANMGFGRARYPLSWKYAEYSIGESGKEKTKKINPRCQLCVILPPCGASSNNRISSQWT